MGLAVDNIIRGLPVNTSYIFDDKGTKIVKGECLYFGKKEVDGMFHQIQRPTYRNFINNYARVANSNQTVHSISKYVVLGAVASLAGVVESVASIIYNLAKTILKLPFSCFIRTGIQRNWKLVKNATALLAYHVLNACTLGILGYSISNENANERKVQDKLISIVRGCPYGDQDVHPSTTKNSESVRFIAPSYWL